MLAMVEFKCGQKRQRSALFHDVPGELVGVPHHARTRQAERERNSSVNLGASRQNAIANDVGIVALCSAPNTGMVRYPAAGMR
jgi:hypothetical protein